MDEIMLQFVNYFLFQELQMSLLNISVILEKKLLREEVMIGNVRYQLKIKNILA